jgi:hypothetical protein
MPAATGEVPMGRYGGNTVQLNNDSGSFADGKITSNITVSGAPPFSANGVILPDRSIQWSNGTHWMKQ